jgi:hypothetical protein
VQFAIRKKLCLLPTIDRPTDAQFASDPDPTDEWLRSTDPDRRSTIGRPHTNARVRT